MPSRKIQVAASESDPWKLQIKNIDFNKALTRNEMKTSNFNIILKILVKLFFSRFVYITSKSRGKKSKITECDTIE